MNQPTYTPTSADEDMKILFGAGEKWAERHDALKRILSRDRTRDRTHERRFADALREQVLELMAQHRSPIPENGFPSTPAILVQAEAAVRAYDKNKERRK